MWDSLVVREIAQNGKTLAREEPRSEVSEFRAADAVIRYVRCIDHQPQLRHLTDPGTKTLLSGPWAGR